MQNPATDHYRRARVMRPDGREMLVSDNAWTTHRMIRLHGQPPASEDYLHLVDLDGTGSYTLVFEPSKWSDFDADGDVDVLALGTSEACFSRPNRPSECQ